MNLKRWRTKLYQQHKSGLFWQIDFSFNIVKADFPVYMKPTLDSAVAVFGAKAKEKLANPAATGQPEDQLRAPFEHLLTDLAELCNLPRAAVAAVGESSVSNLKTRPDYASRQGSRSAQVQRSA